jgi:ribosomal protein S18 acetylase RimI-like enzyme
MVRLVPMDDTAYAAWWQAAIDSYAREKVNAGNWDADDAATLAEGSFRELLPQGRSTPANHLCSIVNEAGEVAGALWFAEGTEGPGRPAYLYDLVVFEAFRRRGYALAALNVLEQRIGEMGMDRIILHVFGHNHAARALYERAGYAVTNVVMCRTIEIPDSAASPQ